MVILRSRSSRNRQGPGQKGELPLQLAATLAFLGLACLKSEFRGRSTREIIRGSLVCMVHTVYSLAGQKWAFGAKVLNFGGFRSAGLVSLKL